MPRKVTAYACKFKCGLRVNTKKEAVRLHEKICFSNPARKACRTCASFIDEGDGPFCFAGDGEYGYLEKDKFATFNCPYWTGKGD